MVVQQDDKAQRLRTTCNRVIWLSPVPHALNPHPLCELAKRPARQRRGDSIWSGYMALALTISTILVDGFAKRFVPIGDDEWMDYDARAALTGDNVVNGVAEAVRGLPWYHTIALPGGIVTP